MKSLFDRVMVWTVDHRWASLGLMVTVTGLAIVGYVRPDWVRGWFVTEVIESDDGPPRSPKSARNQPLPDVEPVRMTNSDAILVVQSSQFFTPEGAKALRHVVEELERLEHVRGVLWMDRVPILNIFGLPEPLFPRSEASPARFLAAKEKALRHPLVGGQLLAEDGQTLLMMVEFDWNYVRTDEQCTTELRQVAERAAAAFPQVPLSFQVTGRIPAFLAAVRLHEDNQLKYQLIGYGMIGLMSIILFRGIRAVFIVAIAPATGVFWTLGFLRFFDLQDNPFNDVILPVLLSLVGLTDGVHLMVQIRKLRASGLTERQAARAALHQVGFACMLTSLTTAVGLGSLTLAHHSFVQEFGWCSVIGVTLTFVAVVTTIPFLCSTLIGRNIHVGLERSLIDRNLGHIGGMIDWVLRRPRSIGGLGIAATLFLTAITLTLRPDERRANSLPESSEAYQALRHLDKTLGGLENASVEITWNNSVDSASPEVLQVTAEVDDLLHSEPLIGFPLSIRNLIDALPGEGNLTDRMSMIELLPPPLKRAFYVPEQHRSIVTFRIQDLGIAKFGPVFDRIEQGLAGIAARHPGFHIALEGDAARRWKNLYQIVMDLAMSLGTASLVILVVLAAAYRSIRMGLIAVVPNLFPLAVTGTWLVWTGQALELTSVCAFTVCLGIAVDDTIHFLTRYEEEREETPDCESAIRNSFSGVGAALVMTTVVLIAGFSTVAFSDSHDHRLFASMGCLTIGSALFGDLILLPALLACFAPQVRT